MTVLRSARLVSIASILLLSSSFAPKLKPTSPMVHQLATSSSDLARAARLRPQSELSRVRVGNRMTIGKTGEERSSTIVVLPTKLRRPWHLRGRVRRSSRGSPRVEVMRSLSLESRSSAGNLITGGETKLPSSINRRPWFRFRSQTRF